MMKWHRNSEPERTTHISGKVRLWTHIILPALTCFAILAISLLPTSAIGQTQASSAMLSGTITDQTGAVIPGATVTLIDEDSGFQRQVKTSDLDLTCSRCCSRENTRRQRRRPA